MPDNPNAADEAAHRRRAVQLKAWALDREAGELAADLDSYRLLATVALEHLARATIQIRQHERQIRRLQATVRDWVMGQARGRVR